MVQGLLTIPTVLRLLFTVLFCWAGSTASKIRAKNSNNEHFLKSILPGWMRDPSQHSVRSSDESGVSMTKQVRSVDNPPTRPDHSTTQDDHYIPKRVHIPVTRRRLPSPRVRHINNNLLLNSGRSYEVLLTNYYDRMYTGVIEIGQDKSNPLKHQRFDLIFDTGSADLWVYSKYSSCNHCTLCTDSQNTKCCPSSAHCCFFSNTMHSYDYNLSSTSSCYDGCKSWSIEYGKGGAKGVLFSDYVFIGSDNYTATVKGQVFATATSWEQDLVVCAEPMDGILGFAMKAAAESNADTVLENLAKQEIIDSKIFSVRLQSGQNSMDGSMFILGEPDPQYYKTDIIYSDVIQAKSVGMWYIEMKGVLYTKNSAETDLINSENETSHTLGRSSDTKWLDKCTNDNPCVALIDTGTSYITMPNKKYNKLVDYITNDINSEVSNDCYTISSQLVCTGDVIDYLPTLWFQFSGYAFSLKPRQYMINDSCTSYVDTYCLGIQAVSGMGSHTYILGDTFLRHYYAVFDESHYQVGFASYNHDLAEAKKRPNDDKTMHTIIIIVFVLAGLVTLGMLGSVMYQRYYVQRNMSVAAANAAERNRTSNTNRARVSLQTVQPTFPVNSSDGLHSSLMDPDPSTVSSVASAGASQANVVPSSGSRASGLARGAPLGKRNNDIDSGNDAKQDGNYMQL